MRVLVTGCARSGTKWMSMVLQARGVRAFHEKEGPDGVVSWLLAAHATSLPKWHGAISSEAFDLVIHQVRNPLHTIASLTTVRVGAFDWASQFIDIDLGWPRRKVALAYWVLWNRLAEAKATIRHRVEDVASDIERANCRPHEPLSWPELDAVDADMAAEARAMARRYGYEVPA